MNGLGTPITLDENTKSRSPGHYARILAELDLNKTILYVIMVERDDFVFYVNLEYENLPYFCEKCQLIGHDRSNYKRNNPITDKPQKEIPKKVNSVYVPKQIVKVNDNKVKQTVVEGVNLDAKDAAADENIDNNIVVEDPTIGLRNIDIVPDRGDKVFDIPREVVVETITNRILNDLAKPSRNLRVYDPMHHGDRGGTSDDNAL